VSFTSAINADPRDKNPAEMSLRKIDSVKPQAACNLGMCVSFIVITVEVGFESNQAPV
jgi:hypothetical protein